MQISAADLTELCTAAARARGADEPTAAVLARAAVRAEALGKTSHGVSHIFDYFEGIANGSFIADAAPEVTRRGAITLTDARGNTAAVAFDAELDNFVRCAHEHGVAVFAARNTFTVGELGVYAHDLAERGLVALAAANCRALAGWGKAEGKVLGTNPHAFGVPAEPRPVVIDQAISQIAYMTIRERAARSEEIPEGWALDASGEPTRSAQEAVEGALLPAGYKMGNIGLMVEFLSGMAGGNWSMDAPSFRAGERPDVGFFVVAFDPRAFESGTGAEASCAAAGARGGRASFAERSRDLVARLEELAGPLPGRRHAPADPMEIDDALHARLLEAAGRD